MSYSKSIIVFESHTVVGLKVKDGDEISNDIGELPANNQYECLCPICEKSITEHQYFNDKTVSTDSNNPVYWFAHKECLKKNGYTYDKICHLQK